MLDSLHPRLRRTLLCKYAFLVLGVLGLSRLPVALTAESVTIIDGCVLRGVRMSVLTVGVEGYRAPCVFSSSDRFQVRGVNAEQSPAQVVKFNPSRNWSNKDVPYESVREHESLWGVYSRPGSTISRLIYEAGPEPTPAMCVVGLLDVVPEKLLKGFSGPAGKVGTVAVLVAVNGVSPNGSEPLPAFRAGLRERHLSLQLSPDVSGGAEAGGHSVFGVVCKAAPIPTWERTTSQWQMQSNSPVGKKEVQVL